jgi:pimeloyl-ACP methyl ester carboxylesterase
MRMVILFATILSLGTATPAVPQGRQSEADRDFDLRCQSLSKQDFTTNTDAPSRVLSAKFVEVGGRPVCEVSGYVHPQAQLTLRIPRDWNERLYFRGCGGFCGFVGIAAADPALAKGYATVATNMGHVGTPMEALWAFNNAEAEIDFAHRATHRTAVAAKRILATFSQAPKKSIFEGCSTGGRQGLVSAERYPEDFDAIIAGAPVRNYLLGSGIQLLWSVLIAEGQGGFTPLREHDVRVLAGHVQRQCDATDGVKDGLISRPEKCRLDWNKPICAGKGDCLSEGAKKTARAIYDGPTELFGAETLRGPEYGSELNWIGTYVAPDGGVAAYKAFMGELFRYLAFGEDPGPGWEPSVSALREYFERARQMQQLYSTTGDISKFAARGGKLILYHGLADQSVVPASTRQYLDELAAAGISKDTYRTYFLAGEGHCTIGQGSSQTHWLDTLENWKR